VPAWIGVAPVGTVGSDPEVAAPAADVVRTLCVVEWALEAVAASAGRATKTHKAVHAIPTVSGRIATSQDDRRMSSCESGPGSAGLDSLLARHRRREAMMYVRPVRRFAPQEVSYLTSVTSVTTDTNKRLNKA